MFAIYLPFCAHSFLFKEYGTRRVNKNCNGNQEHYRESKNEQDTRKGEIHDTLDDVVISPAASHQTQSVWIVMLNQVQANFVLQWNAS
jgi:hypothetical protein